MGTTLTARLEVREGKGWHCELVFELGKNYAAMRVLDENVDQVERREQYVVQCLLACNPKDGHAPDCPRLMPGAGERVIPAKHGPVREGWPEDYDREPTDAGDWDGDDDTLTWERKILADCHESKQWTTCREFADLFDGLTKERMKATTYFLFRTLWLVCDELSRVYAADQARVLFSRA